MAKQPSLIYQVAVGEVPPFYETCIASVDRYCKRFGIEHIVQREPILKIAPVKSARSANALRLGYLPIYEKENAFSYTGRFDKIAILDADIYVKDSAPNLFDEIEDGFAAVLERDMPLTQSYADKVRKHSEGQFSALTDVDWDWNDKGAAYYNMGMMLIAGVDVGEPKEFLRRKEFERFVNGEGHWRWSTDQTLLNYWLKKDGVKVKNLSWKWNALYGAVRDVSEAHFVHFFLSAKQAPGEIEKAIAKL